MGKTKKVTGKAVAIPAGIGMGVLAAMIVTLLGSAGLAVLLSRQKINMDSLGYWRMALLFGAGFLGAMVAMLKIKHRKMQMSLITGGGYFLVLLAMNAMLFGGQYEGVWMSALMVALGSSLAAWIGSRGGSAPKRKHKIPAYR